MRLKCRRWEEESGKKDVLMPGNDVKGKRTGRWRVENGRENRAEPYG
jgi:hypothetical protein